MGDRIQAPLGAGHVRRVRRQGDPRCGQILFDLAVGGNAGTPDRTLRRGPECNKLTVRLGGGGGIPGSKPFAGALNGCGKRRNPIGPGRGIRRSAELVGAGLKERDEIPGAGQTRLVAGCRGLAARCRGLAACCRGLAADRCTKL